LSHLGPDIFLRTVLKLSASAVHLMFIFTPTQNNRRNCSSVYIDIYIFLGSKLEEKIFCTTW